MSIPFHSVSIAAYTQILPAVCATLDKGRAFFDEHGIDPDDVLAFALAEDMKPFHFQVRSVVHHSLGAIEGLRTGHFSPPTPDPPYSWNGLRERVADALALFTAEEFVLSWSVPNLHFHAATTYDMLRLKGVPLGKRDCLGHLRGRNPDAA